MIVISFSFCFSLLSIGRFKQRFAFVVPETDNLHAVLDAAKCADVILFVLDCERGCDDDGDALVACLAAQGLPTSFLVCQVRH